MVTSLHTHVQSSDIHSSQRMGATQVSIAGWMDEHNMVCMYRRVFFSLEKEVSHNMGEFWRCFAKEKKSLKKSLKKYLILPKLEEFIEAK